MKFHKILYLFLISLVTIQSQAMGPVGFKFDYTDQSVTIPSALYHFNVGKNGIKFRSPNVIKDSMENFEKLFSDNSDKSPEELKALFADYFAIQKENIYVIDNRSFSERVSQGLKSLINTGKDTHAYCINFYNQKQETIKAFEPYVKDGFCALVIVGGSLYLLHKTGALKKLSEYKAATASACALSAIAASKYFGFEAIKAYGLHGLAYATNPYVAGAIGLTTLAAAGFYKKISNFIHDYPIIGKGLVYGAIGLHSYLAWSMFKTTANK